MENETAASSVDQKALLAQFRDEYQQAARGSNKRLANISRLGGRIHQGFIFLAGVALIGSAVYSGIMTVFTMKDEVFITLITGLGAGAGLAAASMPFRLVEKTADWLLVRKAEKALQADAKSGALQPRFTAEYPVPDAAADMPERGALKASFANAAPRHPVKEILHAAVKLFWDNGRR